MAPASVTNPYLHGQSYLDCSQAPSARVDAAVQKILDTCYADAKNVLMKHRALLDEISEFLLVKETITGDELMAYVNAESRPALEAAAEQTQTENE